MKQIYLSENGKCYDNEAAAKAADEAFIAEQKAAEEKAMLAKNEKKKLADAIDSAEKEVEIAYKKLQEADKKAQEMIKEASKELSEARSKRQNAIIEFTKKYGTYKKTYNSDDARKELDLFGDPFSFLSLFI